MGWKLPHDADFHSVFQRSLNTKALVEIPVGGGADCLWPRPGCVSGPMLAIPAETLARAT
jgi:hypothetical protein